MKENVIFVFLGLGYFTLYDLFQKVHDWIFLYSLIVFHSVYVPYFHIVSSLLIATRTFQVPHAGIQRKSIGKDITIVTKSSPIYFDLWMVYLSLTAATYTFLLCNGRHLSVMLVATELKDLIVIKLFNCSSP